MGSEEADMRDAIWILLPVVAILVYQAVKLVIQTWRSL